jgi:hypothetical protein
MRTFVRSGRSPSDLRDKIYTPVWVDPWWWINGSEPEKMVMAELARRGIYFQFREPANDLGGFVDPTWEADIKVPQHKIWIEVQGAYYHTLPGQIKSDAIRWAAIKQAGWRPLFWWEWDIRSRLNELFDEVPEFYKINSKVNKKARQRFKTSAGLKFKVGSNVDQLKGHRAAMSNRTKPPSFAFRRAPKRKPKVRHNG